MRFLSACLIAALFATADAVAADLTATVRKAEVNVYAEPNLESGKLTKLKQDDTVGIAVQQGLWYQVKLPDGKTGFVRVNDVRVNYGRVEDSDANIRVLTSRQGGRGARLGDRRRARHRRERTEGRVLQPGRARRDGRQPGGRCGRRGLRERARLAGDHGRLGCRVEAEEG